MRSILLFTFMTLLTISCGGKEYKYDQENTILDVSKKEQSSSAGNLMASAIKEAHDLDIVLYPKNLIKDGFALFKDQPSQSELAEIIELYPDGEKDQFVLGTMSGRDIKTLVRQRSLEKFQMELEVSGLRYEIIFKGGMILSESFERQNGISLNDDEFYSVAISQHFIFSNETFPSYKYRNSIDRIFIDSQTKVSARSALREYLSKSTYRPFLKKIRAQVIHTKKRDLGTKTIAAIQGVSHLSPYYGDIVQTEGIITAIAELDTYPGGQVFYIQSIEPDNNPLTSEAIKVYSEKILNLKMGDLITVKGTVYEETNHIQNGLTATSIRDLESVKVLRTEMRLPAPIEIGTAQRPIPKKHFSTYFGNLYFKPALDLKDGLDFWESLEGMRVIIKNPKIVGFRGGKEQSDDVKSHLTLFIEPNGNIRGPRSTQSGGIQAEPEDEIFNPHIIPLASGPMTNGLNINGNYRMGDIINGELTGIITFSKNLFGDGEYLFLLPEEQESLREFNSSISNRVLSDLADRPSANFKKEQLSIASYNVKNLSPVNKKRIKDTAEMIKSNLNCPDVLGLVEIQDNNGEDFGGNSEANNTLNQLIQNIDCPFKYLEANIDPLLHREGGVPGGNIRVSLIFNNEKLSFIENQLPGPEVETLIKPNGSLNYNPGRIFPNDDAFKNTRKSLIVEFGYKGKKLFVVVNHFNSKLSDTSHFSSMWPMVYPSEVKRSKMAKAVNTFVSRLERRDPDALIAVLGDFNEFIDMPAMRVLESDILYNLMRKLPKRKRYTTNHNGNSQPLDYIFVNKNLQKRNAFFDVLHLNSDYMMRLSDHDPIISVFDI
tara:strand:+ start:65356 stop:67839 length:2484 start_codon:yes stop_codon:yes gene_type:complete